MGFCFSRTRLRFSVFFLGLVTATMAVGCSQGSDIQLSDPSKPPPLPNSQSNPGETEPSTSPKDPTSPQDPTDPISSVPAPVRYRILCDDRFPPYIMAISSLASSTGFGAGIKIDEPRNDLDFHENPIVVSLPKFGEARLLFSARRVAKNPFESNPTRYIFVADADLTSRLGVAKHLGTEVAVSAQLKALAETERMSLRTYGVSDGGKYLLIGQHDGYRIVDANTLATIGLLQVGSAETNVNPSLRESDMMLSVASWAGSGSFASKLYSVGLAPSGGGVKSLTPVATVSSLRRPLVAVGSEAAESFAAIDTLNRVLVVSPLKPAAATKSLIAGLPTKGRLASSAAFWRDSTSRALRGAIVFEEVVPVSGSLTRIYKVEQGFVRALAIDEAKLSATALGADFEYPAEAKQTIELGVGMSGGHPPGVRDLRASVDGLSVFGLFPGSSSAQLYRLTSQGLQRVSQEVCTGFSIGREL